MSEKHENFNYEKFSKDYETKTFDIPGQLASIPSLMAFYGHQRNIWESVVKSLKDQLALKESEIILELRNGTEKYTAPQAEAYVRLDPEVIKIRKALIKAEEEKNEFFNAFETMTTKGKLLQSISAREKAELGQYHSGGIIGDSLGNYGSGLNLTGKYSTTGISEGTGEKIMIDFISVKGSTLNEMLVGKSSCLGGSLAVDSTTTTA